MKSAALLIWLATKKTAELPWGGPAFFSTLVGPGWGTIWLPSLRHRGRSQSEPPTKLKTQSKSAPLKNQRFQFWRWLLKTAPQGLVQVGKMIFEISCSADLACDQKNSGASMGGSSCLLHLGGPGWGTEALPEKLPANLQAGS